MNPLVKATKWLSILIVALLTVLLLVGIIFLGSEPGRLKLAHTAINSLNHSNSLELQINIKGLKAPNLGLWQLASLQIMKEDKLWVDASNIRLFWNPLALLRQHIDVERLVAANLTLYRFSTPTKIHNNTPLIKHYNPPPKTALNIPHILLQYFEVSSVNTVAFEPKPSAPPLPKIRLQGKAERLKDSTLNLSLFAATFNAIPSHLKINLSSNVNKVMHINGTLNEAAGGYINKKLKLPNTQNINLNFSADVSEDTKGYALLLRSLQLPINTHHINISGQAEAAKDLQSGQLHNIQIDINGAQQKIKGSWKKQHINANLTLSKLPLQLLELWNIPMSEGELNAQLELNGLIASPKAKGRIALKTVYNTLPLTLKLIGNGDKNQLDIEGFTASFDQTKITGKGRLDISGNKSNLTASAEGLTLATLNSFNINTPKKFKAEVISAQAKLIGNALNPDGTLTALAKGHYNKQSFTLNTNFSKKNDAVFINNTSLELNEEGVNTQSIINAQGNINIKTLKTNITATAHSIPLQLLNNTGIKTPTPLNGKASFKAKVLGDLATPQIMCEATVQGDYDNIPFTLQAKGQHIKSHSQLENLSLSTFQTPALKAHGYIKGKEFNLNIHANELPTQLLSTLGWNIQEGKFNADFIAQGTTANPRLTGSAQYETKLLSYDPEGNAKKTPFILGLTAKTKNKNLILTSSFTHKKEAPGYLNVDIPITPYSLFLNQEKQVKTNSSLPVHAFINGSVDLQLLSFLVDPELHSFTGKINTQMYVSGTVNNPKFNGTLNLMKGRYENPISGTIIDNIICSLTAQKIMLSVSHCQASDGHDGHYKLLGHIEIPSQVKSLGSIDMNVSIKDANIIKRSDIESNTSGEVVLSGNFKSLLAKGALNVTPLSATIDSSLSSGIPSIKVERAGTISQTSQETKTKKPMLPEVSLDLKITANQQAFLRGRGLEAELQGQVHLRGRLDKTRYDGEFKTLRGIYEFFGKKFIIEQGQVNFVNQAIVYSINASYNKNEQRIDVMLSGSNDNFDLTFSAIPKMPEEEILAYLIFGKKVQNMSPFEAIQLASALQTLRGGNGSSFDPIGTTRELLGVDTLSIENAKTDNGETGINVGMGKYINERVYVELQRTPDPSNPWKGSIEIELSPSMSFESFTGGSTGIEGAKLKWTRDY